MISKADIYDSKHSQNAATLGKNSTETTQTELVHSGAINIYPSNCSQEHDSTPPITTAQILNLAQDCLIFKEELKMKNLQLEYLMNDFNVKYKNLSSFIDSFNEIFLPFFSASEKMQNFSEFSRKFSEISRSFQLFKEKIFTAPIDSWEGKKEKKTKTAKGPEACTFDHKRTKEHEDSPQNTGQTDHTSSSEVQKNKKAKYNNDLKIEKKMPKAKIVTSKIDKKIIEIPKTKRKKLGKDLQDIIWQRNDFEFPTTKYKIMKMIGLPGMQISALKSLISDKLNIKPNFYGGLHYNIKKKYWTILLNERIIIEKNLLNHHKFEKFTIEEINEEAEILKKLFEKNDKELKVKNKPLSIALKILENGINENSLDRIKSVIEIDYEQIIDLNGNIEASTMSPINL